jgi:hypothetical protein
MLYARSDAGGTSFEPQRNLMTVTTTLDGGGSIAADAAGGVFAAWHANALDGSDGEDARRVWIARSTNDGETFAGEAPVSDPVTGVCGCCALRLFTDAHGALHLMYRSATDVVHRDIYALVSRDAGRTFSGGRVHDWEIGACPMTSMAMAEAERLWRAWETDGQVYFQALDSAEPPLAPPLGASAGDAGSRKHPRLAVLPDGRLLLAWAEGTGWARGGSVAWQAFDSAGRPLGTGGRQAGLPAWSFPAVVARPDGGFTILY